MSDLFNYDALVDAARYYCVEPKINKEKYVNDCLIIAVDFTPFDDEILVVMRKEGNKMYAINQFRNEEAREIYNKLIGVRDE